MLEILKNSSNGSLSSPKIIGVGNAGVNFVDRFTIERAVHVDTVAINTDLQSLTSSVADFKLPPLGEQTTRGLGTGGNPLLGTEAALESEAILQSAVKGAGMVILCAGLGGGTSAGALPLLLKATRADGIPTAVLVTLPFQFEGPRRVQQARETLEKIRPQAEILLVFENDRMLENAQVQMGLAETFTTSDRFLTQAATALTRLLAGNASSPLQLSAGDLKTVLRPHSEGNGKSEDVSLFGFGQAEGPDRAHQALECALKCPLLDRKKLFRDRNEGEEETDTAAAPCRLLVHIDGASDLLLSEVQTIMQKISSLCHPSTHILLGVHTHSHLAPTIYQTTFSSLTVSLLGTLSSPLEKEFPLPLSAASSPTCLVIPKEKEEEQEMAMIAPNKIATPPLLPTEESEQSILQYSLSEDPLPEPLVPEEEKLSPPPSSEESASTDLAENSLFKELIVETVGTELSAVPREELALPTSRPNFSQELTSPTPKPLPKPRQEVLKFEPITRGRFEKSEPTIFEGEDIDVPTFLRLKIKLK